MRTEQLTDEIPPQVQPYREDEPPQKDEPLEIWVVQSPSGQILAFRRKADALAHIKGDKERWIAMGYAVKDEYEDAGLWNVVGVGFIYLKKVVVI